MKNINCTSSCCSYISYLLSYLFTPAFICFVLFCLFVFCLFFLFLVNFQTICDAYTQESAANETKRAKKVLRVSKT